MSTNGRSTRGSTAMAEELASMTIRDRLIFAQAVYEFGAGPSGWTQVSKLLSQHPLVAHLKSIFSTQNCPNIYNNLLAQASLQRSDNVEVKKATTNRKLAEHFYRSRILELKAALASEETKFRALITEIDEIRAGKWDDKIRAELGIQQELEKENVEVIEVDTDEPPTQVEEAENVVAVEESDHVSPPNDLEEATVDMKPSEEPVDISRSERSASVDHVSVVVEAASETQDDEDDSGEAPMEMSSPMVIADERRAASPPKSDILVGSILPEPEKDFEIAGDQDQEMEQVEKQENQEEEEEKEEEKEETAQPDNELLQRVEEEEGAVQVEVSEDGTGADEDVDMPQDTSSENIVIDEVVEEGLQEEEPAGEEPAEEEPAEEEPAEEGPAEEEPSVEEPAEEDVEFEKQIETDNKTVTRSSARLRSRARSPQRQTSVLKDKAPKHANKPASKDSQASQTSRTSRRSAREPTIEEEPVDTEEQQSRHESEPQEETEREETPTQVKVENEEAVEEAVEVVSRDSTPPKREVGKRKAVEVEGAAHEPRRGRKRIREESEPTGEVASPGASSTLADQKNQKVERKRFQNVISMLHQQIASHRNGTIFHNPIKPSDAPDYYEIVKRPMDLKTIKGRVREGQISTSSEYTRDIYLMFANSLMYNRPTTDIYEMAEEMMLESEAHINTFRQTEGFAQARTRSG